MPSQGVMCTLLVFIRFGIYSTGQVGFERVYSNTTSCRLLSMLHRGIHNQVRGILRIFLETQLESRMFPNMRTFTELFSLTNRSLDIA